MKYTRFHHLAALVLLVSAFHLASAEWEQLGPNYFVAGIPADQFEFFAAPDVAGRQRQQNWCWAATIQMVLNFHGLYVTQEQIVERIFGHLVDAPGVHVDALPARSSFGSESEAIPWDRTACSFRTRPTACSSRTAGRRRRSCTSVAWRCRTSARSIC